MTDVQFSHLLEVVSGAVVVIAFALGYLGGIVE